MKNLELEKQIWYDYCFIDFNFIINTTTYSSSSILKVCDYFFRQVIFPKGVNYVLIILFFYLYKPFWVPLKIISSIRILEIHPYSKLYVQTRAII